jgi:hypothetical protein
MKPLSPIPAIILPILLIIEHCEYMQITIQRYFDFKVYISLSKCVYKK